MKKYLLSLLALVLAAVSLAAGLWAKSSAGEELELLRQRVTRLEEENQQLRQRQDRTEEDLGRLRTVASLESWSLEAQAWADSTGADICFTAVPAEDAQGVSATLLVYLEGRQTAAVPCAWDGAAFTAVAQLNPADGYSYYCLLQSPGGTEQLLLASPEEPGAPIAVYLASALNRYCNVMLSDWAVTEAGLTLKEVYAHAQLPRLSPEGEVALTGAFLELRRNGAVVETVNAALSQDEVALSFSAAITDVSFPLPELAEGDVLELYLRVKLSAGEDLTAYGASWYLEEGVLTSVVG